MVEMAGHAELFDLFFLKFDQAAQFFLMPRYAAGKQLPSQGVSFFKNVDFMAALGRHPGHIQTAGATANHHNFFGFLGGYESHFFFPAQHGIDQAFDAAFSEYGLHAGVAGDAYPDFIQAAFPGFIGHIRICQKSTADAHKIRLAL